MLKHESSKEKNTQKLVDFDFPILDNQTWLPFVGDKYLNLPSDKKLLIVGESHYHNNSKESIEKHKSIEFTRHVIKELAIKRSYCGTKIFSNLHKALFAGDEFNSKVFWNLTAFYNFVQRPMETNKSRPSYNDFYNGWPIFFETIKVLKPRTCLFIGVEASNSLGDAIVESDYEIINLVKGAKISSTRPRSVTIADLMSTKTELIFIQHTSKYFSWRKWNVFLNSKLGKQIRWLKKEIFV